MLKLILMLSSFTLPYVRSLVCKSPFTLVGQSCFYTAGVSQNWTEALCECQKYNAVLPQAITAADKSDIETYGGPKFWGGMTDMINGDWVTQWNTKCSVGCPGHDCYAHTPTNPLEKNANTPFCSFMWNGVMYNDDFCAFTNFYTTVCWYNNNMPALAIDGCENKYHTVCPPPVSSVANGIVAINIVSSTCGRRPVFGSTVTLQCDCGFAPAEPVVSECQTNNQWNGSLSCTAVNCQPVIVANGWIQYSKPASPLLLSCNLTATVGCDLGYFLLGTASLACSNLDGSWIGSTPQCLAPCLPLLEHFSRIINYSTSGINNVYMHGTAANGTCLNSSFKQNLSLSPVVCNNGSWSDSISLCLPSCGDIRTWPYLSNITFTHGKLNNFYPYSTVATFACEEYFQLIGNATATCVDGKWVGLNKQWCKVLIESKFFLWWWPWIVGFCGTILSALLCSCLWKWWISQKKTATKQQNTSAIQ